ncbi:MAG TPA: hypothetical protein PKD64_05470 [Pirellulaceae bacterium]|nr:hypothetical protein [Pirellulaceae bacterium]HMO91627.1 hypothetical protein [Pirellulaceae bacterium]HMP68324.1 hypothetical protein [Pirellulaceae bacterium]
MAENRHINRIGVILVELLGPLLIMLMVGSLAYLALEIVHGGLHTDTLKFKFSLFTIAAVLISRISIQFGVERAAMYGLLLAAAIIVASSTYVSIIGLIPVIAFVWWAAGRLTWDVTFIDGTRDTSAQGIVDVVKHQLRIFRESKNRAVLLASASNQPSTPSDDERVSPFRVGGSQIQQPPSASSWSRLRHFLFGRRQSNMPGLWVFYFVLAGFPIFGLGQALIHPSNVAGRHLIPSYFAVYMSAALTLLMLTSLIGLNRYLEQRNAMISLGVAKNWILLGIVLTLVIIAVTFWMPRPTSNFSIAGWVPRIEAKTSELIDSLWSMQGSAPTESTPSIQTGPNPRESSDMPDRGSGKDAASGTDSKSADSQAMSNQGTRQVPGKSGESQSGNDANKRGEGKGSNNSQQNQSRADHEKSDSGSKAPDKSNSQSGDRNKENGGKTEVETSAKTTPNRDGENQNDGSSLANDESKDKASRQEQTKSAGGFEPEKNQKSLSEQKREQSQPFQPPNQYSDNRQAENSETREEDDSGRSNAGQRDSRSQGDKKLRNAPKQQPESMSSVLNWLGTFLKMLLWLVFLIVGLFMLYRYRAEVRRAWHHFIEELKNLWSRLFSRKRQASDDVMAAGLPNSIGIRAQFVHFQDPFLSNAVDSMTPQQVVKYTFEAMEAWGYENKCARESDQTPFEFAKAVQNHSPSLKKWPQHLADLYCQMAYASSTLSKSDIQELGQLWSAMRLSRGELARERLVLAEGQGDIKTSDALRGGGIEQ